MAKIGKQDVPNYMEQLEKETMNDIWIKKDTSFVDNSDFIRKQTKRMSDTIHHGVEQAVQRMIFMGYTTDELEISTVNSHEGFTIQVGVKKKHRKISEFEVFLDRMYLGTKIKAGALIRQFTKNRDISPRILSDFGMTSGEISDLHSGMYSRGYMVVTCDFFHDCQKIPVGSVEVQEGEPKPFVKNCPVCEKKIKPMTSWWGGYRYQLSEQIYETLIENYGEPE
jgi:hypothetical protein